MAVPAARYLVRFDEPERDLAADPPVQESAVVCQAPVIEDDSAERLLEAHRRGKEEGVAIARVVFERELAEARRGFAEQMEAARVRWNDEVIEKLANQMPAAFHDVEARIAACVSRILRPALLSAIRDEIISSLMSGFAKLRSGDSGHMISVSGSNAMLDKLRERLPELEMAIEFLPSDNVEVRATADQTVLESQIQAWLSVLDTGAE